MQKVDFLKEISQRAGCFDEIEIRGKYGLVISHINIYVAIYVMESELVEFFIEYEDVLELLGENFFNNSKKTQFAKIKQYYLTYQGL